MVEDGIRDPENFKRFLRNCKCAIFSRVSPTQKSKIVSTVKDITPDCSCLAVGDGANDVAMIKNAHVGVGIVGKEGKLAANSADFSITQFYHLAYLILVYGAWNYERVTKGILYFIYKNIVFVFPAICFIFANQYRPIFLYDPVAALLFTVLFSSFLILPISAFDYRISSKFRIKYPILYKATASNKRMRTGSIVSWLTNGVFHGAIIYFIIRHAISIYRNFFLNRSLKIA